MRAEQHQDQRTLQFAASAVEEDGGGEIEWGRRRQKNGRRERAEREGDSRLVYSGYMTCCCYLGNGEYYVTAERGSVSSLWRSQT